MANLIPTEKRTFFKVNESGELLEIDIFTGEIVNSSKEIVVPYKYSLAISEKICQYIREGMTVKDISSLPDMPDLHTIYSWRSLNPDFKLKMDNAREDRADFFFGKAVEVAEEAKNATKEFVPGMKLAVDTYKWAAEKGAPSRYGAKLETKIEHSGKVGFFAVNTGVDRTPLPSEEPTDIIDAECITKENLCDTSSQSSESL